MQNSPQEIARDRVHELAADPRYRPYVIGYLLSCLPERHWAALVDAALEWGESMDEIRKAREKRTQALLEERY